MDEEGIKKLFREAASIPGINTPIEVTSLSTVEEEEKNLPNLEKMTEIVESNLRDKWPELKEAMEGRFADRFMKEMDMLSGREFIRVYMKMIEYFKPKIVRIEGEKDKEDDNVIKIEIHHSNPQQEETIDITAEEE